MLLDTPRWPENVVSAPSGPWTTLTAGVSVSRSSNLRPRIGVVAIVLSLSVLAGAVRLAATVDACVVTVTVSATPDSFIEGVSRADSPTLTATFSCTSVAKPGSLYVTVYRPGGTCRPTNRPSRSVTRVRVKFVSTLRSSTVTPGSTAPLESVTTPSITAVVICDCADVHAGTAKDRATASRILMVRMDG